MAILSSSDFSVSITVATKVLNAFIGYGGPILTKVFRNFLTNTSRPTEGVIWPRK